MNLRTRLGMATVVALGISTLALAADGPVITQAWARATAPGVDVGAVYMTIDGGPQADQVVSASTSRASMVHLHTVEASGGVAKMRPIDGIDVPAGKRVVLAPSGTHVMLMGLAKPLVAGEKFPLTLHFAKSGDRAVDVTVRAAGEGAAPAQPPH